MKRRTGLTLIELAIAVVIVGVAASVAVPAAMNRRILANEASAIAALRDIATAQERFRAAGVCDVDRDGVAEYGLIRELSDAMQVRTDSSAATIGNRVESPLLPREFRRFNRNSEVRRAGYLFRMFLPSYGGDGTPEFATGALVMAVDSDLAETTWCCYAWPERRGVTGGRTFFVNQTAEIVSTDAGYSGTSVIGGYASIRSQHPRANAGAAFAAPGSLSSITGAVAVGTVGRDGNLWRLVTPHAEARDLVARGRLYGGYRSDRRRSASVEIVSHEDSSGTRETLVVSASDLRPGSRHQATITGYGVDPPILELRARAGMDGRVVLRFDSRRNRYPDGVSSLTELVGGYITLSDDHDEVWPLEGTVPAFEAVARAATPVAETIAADEASAIAALREIAVAQTNVQAMKSVDVNVDGVGEFGLFRELTGLFGVRTTSNGSAFGTRLDPPLLPSSFAAFDVNSDASGSGYLFKMFLPGSGGHGIPEVPWGALGASIDSDLAATTWCCYASPQRYGRTGGRTFFINQTGDIVATDDWYYTGTGVFDAMNAGAAFPSGGLLTNITGTVATGTVGRDGNLWRAVPSRPDEHDFAVRGALTPTAPGAATGKFVVKSRQLMNATDESIDVDATGLDVSTAYRVVLIDASNAESVFGTTTSDASGGVAFRFDGRFQSLPASVASVTAFGGGAIELRDGDTPVLSGAIPVFATVLGPVIADSSVVFNVKRPLDQLPKSLPRCGSLDVRVTNAPDGRREELVVEITTYDRGATYDVVAVDGIGAGTLVGAIDVGGLRGVGKLSLDMRRGDVAAGAVVALSGARIEVRSSTGAVVLAGTMPVVQ